MQNAASRRIADLKPGDGHVSIDGKLFEIMRMSVGIGSRLPAYCRSMSRMRAACCALRAAR